MNNVPPDRTPVPLRALNGRRADVPGQALDADVREALRFVDDPIALEDSCLVSLPAVRQLVAGRFKGKTCAEGQALRKILCDELARIAEDLDGTVVASLARAIHDGRTQAALARELEINEEYLCRRWKPVLTRLVRESLTAARDDVAAAA
ncbi:MAG: hypothetical protein ACKVT1_08535 [Dehalococcoidia bacterium]